MIWLLRISFSLVAVVPLLGAAVSGSIELLNSRDPIVRKQKNYSGVVVWLEPAENKAPAVTPKHVKMVQKGKTFQPHVLAIPVGSTVEFPNVDPIFHNAFSNFAGQPFDTGLYPPGTSPKIQFRRDGVVRVFCNIHSFMSAVIVVLRTPYFATTGRSGAFEIGNVAPGTYRMRIWHERATEQTLKALERTIEVPGSSLKLPALRISESGFLEVPHKNKHGHDYPPPPPDNSVYPGARK